MMAAALAAAAPANPKSRGDRVADRAGRGSPDRLRDTRDRGDGEARPRRGAAEGGRGGSRPGPPPPPAAAAGPPPAATPPPAAAGGASNSPAAARAR